MQNGGRRVDALNNLPVSKLHLVPLDQAMALKLPL